MAITYCSKAICILGKNSLGFVNFYLYGIKEIAAVGVIQKLLIVFLSTFKMKRVCHLALVRKNLLAHSPFVQPLDKMVLRAGLFIILRRHFLAKLVVTFLALTLFSGCGQDTNAPLSLDKRELPKSPETLSQQRLRINQNVISAREQGGVKPASL